MDRGTDLDRATAPLRALGLMSGTSLDGIDVALLQTDGETAIHRGPARTFSYTPQRRRQLRALLDAIAASPDAPPSAEMHQAERDLTLDHAAAVNDFLHAENLPARHIHLLGFHGQTVLHRPERAQTLQLGDAALLAHRTGISVIHDFRSADMRVGGQGAPLAPLYHAALVAAHRRQSESPQQANQPVCVVNLGGIANLTWIPPQTDPSQADNNSILAFDVAPCNALLDDWASRHTGAAFDKNGRLAAQGQACDQTLANLLAHPFLSRPPPKSLDRLDFSLQPFAHLNPADGAATITAFIAAALAAAVAHLPQAPHTWLLCGGGRHNPVLRAELQQKLPGHCQPGEEWNWPGDSLEAEAFAWLAVRSKRGLPLSLPGTTGASHPVCGGRETPAPPNGS